MTTYLIIIPVAVLLYLAYAFNQLVRSRAMVNEAYSGMDVQLKKRYNLVPALVQVLKAHMNHERETLEKVVAARATAMKAEHLDERQNAENSLTNTLNQCFITVENYPELKSNPSFLDLQTRLTDVEDDIEKSRRYYNAVVRDNNIAVQSFPSLIVARLFHFKRRDFFEIDNPSHRQANPIHF